jgi:hypothetical protein
VDESDDDYVLTSCLYFLVYIQAIETGTIYTEESPKISVTRDLRV